MLDYLLRCEGSRVIKLLRYFFHKTRWTWPCVTNASKDVTVVELDALIRLGTSSVSRLAWPIYTRKSCTESRHLISEMPLGHEFLNGYKSNFFHKRSHFYPVTDLEADGSKFHVFRFELNILCLKSVALYAFWPSESQLTQLHSFRVVFTDKNLEMYVFLGIETCLNKKGIRSLSYDYEWVPMKWTISVEILSDLVGPGLSSIKAEVS